MVSIREVKEWLESQLNKDSKKYMITYSGDIIDNVISNNTKLTPIYISPTANNTIESISNPIETYQEFSVLLYAGEEQRQDNFFSGVFDELDTLIVNNHAKIVNGDPRMIVEISLPSYDGTELISVKHNGIEQNNIINILENSFKIPFEHTTRYYIFAFTLGFTSLSSGYMVNAINNTLTLSLQVDSEQEFITTYENVVFLERPQVLENQINPQQIIGEYSVKSIRNTTTRSETISFNYVDNNFCNALYSAYGNVDKPINYIELTTDLNGRFASTIRYEIANFSKLLVNGSAIVFTLQLVEKREIV